MAMELEEDFMSGVAAIGFGHLEVVVAEVIGMCSCGVFDVKLC